MGKKNSNNSRQASVMSWLQKSKTCSSEQQSTDSNENQHTTPTHESIEKNIENENTNGSLQNEIPENTVEIVNMDGKPDNVENIKNSKQSEAETNLVDVRYNKSLTLFHKNHIHRVRCKECFKFPDIVKLHSLNKTTPPITTEYGMKFRNDTVTNCRS